jgi:hypothetical protein
MTKCTPRLLSVALLAACYLSACSGEDRDGNGTIKKNKDAAVEEMDSGIVNNTGDSGVPASDTGVNPNPMDAGGNPNDTGVNPNPTDSGVMDTGVMPQPGCTSNADCIAPNNTCLSDATLEPCNGANDCLCAQSCAFENPTSCAGNNRCAFLGTASTVPGKGLCIPANGQAAHGAACTGTFDAQGQLTGSNCEVGNYCWGAFPDKPTGKCAQFCNPQGGPNCTGLTGYTCDNFGDPASQVGLCLIASTANDNGEACAAPNTCTGGSCETGLGGICTEDCVDPLQSCSQDSTCLYFAQDFSIALCMRNCTSGAAGGPGDVFCAGVNMNLICENVASDPTIGVCFPRCTMDAECGAVTCNVATGHCN